VRVVTIFEDLLVVQQFDTTLDQLRHRLATLPERSQLDAASGRAGRAAAEVEEVAARLHRIRLLQKEAEDHAVLLQDKASAATASLYDGSVTAHKELEAVQAEIASLTTRQEVHEDEALEQMELAEPVEVALGAARAELDAANDALAAAEIALAEAITVVETEIAVVETDRSAALEKVPADLMATYDSLRAGLGVAVARLVGARCEGCHLEIPSAQLESVRRAPADDVVSCPECGRILVR